MNSFSHRLIGKILLKHLQEQYDIELDRRSFLYGNMVPDFTRTYKSRPHRRQFWERYLKSEIRELTRHKQSSRRFGSAYSRRLGIICHFYADFFCFAHTSGFDGSSVIHFKYEWALDRYLRKNADGLSLTELGAKTLPPLDTESIYGEFESLQTDYFICRPDFMRDLLYTLRACAGALSAITECSVVTEEEPARLGGLVATAANG